MHHRPVSLMRKRLRAALLIVVALYLLAGAAIALDGVRDRDGNADMIVVPGNEVGRDGTPSARLRARLDCALALYRAGRAPLVFVSGGTGLSGYDEARAMGDYLLARGVPAMAIVRDRAGIDTAATARNAAAYARVHHLGSALVATQYFHVSRTSLALRQQGLRVTGTAHAAYAEWRDLYSLAREVPGMAAYALRGAR